MISVVIRVAIAGRSIEQQGIRRHSRRLPTELTRKMTRDRTQPTKTNVEMKD